MKQRILKGLKVSTPVSVAAVLVIVLSVISLGYILLSNGSGELASGILIYLIVFACFFYVIDRLLLNKIRRITLVYAELLLLVIVTTSLFFVNKTLRIVSTTNEQYFMVFYDNAGLTENDFKRTGLFNKELSFGNNAEIHLSNSFIDKKQFDIVTPRSWGGYSVSRADTTVMGNRILVECYANNMPKERRDSLLKNAMATYLSKHR
jgi:hypothetical protein